jgi:hypothetical protein
MAPEDRRWRLLRTGQDVRGGKWRWSRRRRKPAAIDEAPGPVAAPSTAAARQPDAPVDPAPEGTALEAEKADLEKAERNFRRAQQIVARQSDLVFEMRRRGLPSNDAEKLLRTFQEIQRQCSIHLLRLQIRARKEKERG